MKYSIILLMSVSLVFGFGCKKKSPTDGNGGNGYTIEDYFPLAIGNKWTYQIHYYSPDTTYNFTRNVSDTGRWAQKKVYQIEQIGIGPNQFWALYYNDELRVYYQYPSDTSDYYIELKEPLSEGQKWHPTPQDAGKLVIINIGSEITVPAGTFDKCVEVNWQAIEWGSVDVMCYAPEVGCVKSWSDSREIKLVSSQLQ